MINKLLKLMILINLIALLILKLSIYKKMKKTYMFKNYNGP